jgi:hypothetical protein
MSQNRCFCEFAQFTSLCSMSLPLCLSIFAPAQDGNQADARLMMQTFEFASTTKFGSYFSRPEDEYFLSLGSILPIVCMPIEELIVNEVSILLIKTTQALWAVKNDVLDDFKMVDPSHSEERESLLSIFGQLSAVATGCKEKIDSFLLRGGAAEAQALLNLRKCAKTLAEIIEEAARNRSQL